MSRLRTALLAAGALLVPTALPAQQIAFESDLPRVMVFLQEKETTAATLLTSFLREAGFEVIDPVFARSAAEKERARLALAGDDDAAADLGRDLGAQVLILGSAPTDAAANPVDPALQVGTAELNVRALRLDEPRLVASGNTRGRAADATAGGARTAALRKATEALLYQTGFLGSVATDWSRRSWNDDAYWAPQLASTAPGADRPRQSTESSGGATLAILETAAFASDAKTGTRGIEVVKRPADGPLQARVRGLVSDPSARVSVGGHSATVRAASAEERKRYRIEGPGALFEASVPLAAGQDTLRVRAEGAAGGAEVMVRPVVAKRWAVVIGVSDYKDKQIQPLQYADDDARAMYEFLRSPEGGAVPEPQIRLLLNERATTAAIREALFVFLQQAGEGDLVTVYVASHGAADPNRPANLYILSHDTDLGALASTAFPMWDFKTAVRRQIAAERVVVIADACHSAGTLVRETKPIGGAFADLFDPSRRVTLSAAAEDELSHEGPQWGNGHGAFTHALLEGLRGKADADGNGVVTFMEASDYVRTRVAKETEGRQNPTWAGLGDLPLAELGAAAKR